MRKIFPLFLAVFAMSLTGGFAQAQQSGPTGLFKLDMAHSHLGPDLQIKSMKLYIRENTPQMLSYKITAVDANGKVARWSWHGPENGTLIPVHPASMRLKISFMPNAGKWTAQEVYANGRKLGGAIIASKDGMTIWEHFTGTTKDGQAFTEKLVWHKVMHKKHAM